MLLSAGVDEEEIQLSMPTYAVVGSAALLAGVTRMLLSSCVIIFETSGASNLVVPLIATSVVGKVRGLS